MPPTSGSPATDSSGMLSGNPLLELFGAILATLVVTVSWRIRTAFVELRQARDALRNKETRYRSALSALSEGVGIQGSGGEVLAANNAAAAILGWPLAQLRGLSLDDPRWQTVDEDGKPWPEDRHPVRVTLRTGRAVADAVMGIHKQDGALTWISLNTRPIERVGKELPDAVVTSFRDISLRKEAETQQRIAAIAFESQASMIITDVDGVILRVNRTFTENTGYTAEDAVAAMQQEDDVREQQDQEGGVDQVQQVPPIGKDWCHAVLSNKTYRIKPRGGHAGRSGSAC